MSRKDDEFDELAVELIKLTIIATILAIIGVIVLARWLCQAAAWSSVKLAERSEAGATSERRSAWIAVAWLAVFALAGLATLNAPLALAGLGLGIVVARLVYGELTAWREVQSALRRPGSLVLGGFKDSWGGVTKPFALTPERTLPTRSSRRTDRLRQDVRRFAVHRSGYLERRFGDRHRSQRGLRGRCR